LNEVPQRTEVLRGKARVMEAMVGFLRHARNRMDLCGGVISGAPVNQDEEMTRAYLDLTKKGTRLRLITEITKPGIGQAKELMKTIDLRNMNGISSYFGVSDDEYVAVPGKEEFNPSGPLLYSNEEPFVKHHQALFEMLWERAIPADVRIEELEKGEELGETKVTFSTQEIFDSANGFADGMKEEALVIVPREGGVMANRDLFQKIARRARMTGAKVRVLGRFSKDEEELLKSFQVDGFQSRVLAPGRIANLALGIYDRRGMGLVQYIYPELERSPSRTYLTGVISTNRETVAGIAAIFDSLWEESELRQEAELMRDILTHDIRNYNQISLSNAEVLRDRLGSEKALERFVDSILGAIEGSSALIEKTKMLARIMGDKEAQLEPVNMSESIERSLSLVTKAFPDKHVEVTHERNPETLVVADSLLDQVFVNVFSNAVRYTEAETVPLEIDVEPSVDAAGSGTRKERRYWKVVVTDHGRGIPDDSKAVAATRYLAATRGKGLGLSIARALAVDRYAGRFELKNRVEGDYRKGTKVEIWLPRA
jgi:two-component system, OmpR family, sensor histidine kinase VicK